MQAQDSDYGLMWAVGCNSVGCRLVRSGAHDIRSSSMGVRRYDATGSQALVRAPNLSEPLETYPTSFSRSSDVP